MPHFDLLDVVDVNLPVLAGVSLYSQFASYMFDNYALPDDPNVLSDVVRTKCFRVHAQAFPYQTVIDFQQHLPNIKRQTAMGDLRLVYDMPRYADHDELHADARRSMRTLTKNDRWTNQDGSLLVHEEITRTLERLHAHAAGMFPIDENTPRDGKYLLIFNVNGVHDSTGQMECQVARWVDGAWRYQHDEYTIAGTHFRFL